MQTPKEKLEFITNNITQLPQKDINLAKQFLENREFYNLQELVDSVLYKANKNLASTTPKEEYKTLVIDTIEELAVKIDEYITQVYGENYRLNAADLEDDDEYYDNFNDYDLNDL